MQSTTLSRKISSLLEKFSQFQSREEKYKFILAQTKTITPLPLDKRTPENLVQGCQSILYLGVLQDTPVLKFAVHSEALISLGLASLLLQVYNEESAECIATNPPVFLEQLGIATLLSPGRSGGVRSMFKKMQYISVKLLTQQSTNVQSR